MSKICVVEGCERMVIAKNYCHAHYKRFKKYGNPNEKIEFKKKLEYEVDYNGCFNITSHYKDKDGYGKLYRNKKYLRAHRFVYEQMFGEIPEGLVVRHKCDNPSCINPEHLELGTIKENSKDKVERNRSAKGTEINTSKLTEYQVKKIKKELENGTLVKTLAKSYPVCESTLYKIKNNITWCHI